MMDGIFMSGEETVVSVRDELIDAVTEELKRLESVTSREYTKLPRNIVAKLILEGDIANHIDDAVMEGDYRATVCRIGESVISVSARVNGVFERALLRERFEYPQRHHTQYVLLNDAFMREIISVTHPSYGQPDAWATLLCWDVYRDHNVTKGRCVTRILPPDRQQHEQGQARVTLGPLQGVKSGEWITLIADHCVFYMGAVRIDVPTPNFMATSLTLPTAWLPYVEVESSHSLPTHFFFKTGHVPDWKRLRLGGSMLRGAVFSMSAIPYNHMTASGLTVGTPLYEVQTEPHAFHVMRVDNTVELRVGTLGLSSAHPVKFQCVFPGLVERGRLLIAHRTVLGSTEMRTYAEAFPHLSAKNGLLSRMDVVANAIAMDSPDPVVYGVQPSSVSVISRGNYWPDLSYWHVAPLQYGKFPFCKHSTGKWPFSECEGYSVFEYAQVPIITRVRMYEIAIACANATSASGGAFRSTWLFQRVLASLPSLDAMQSAALKPDTAKPLCKHVFEAVLNEYGVEGRICTLCQRSLDGLILDGYYVV